MPNQTMSLECTKLPGGARDCFLLILYSVRVMRSGHFPVIKQKVHAGIPYGGRLQASTLP